jgi:hypothetical protein
MKISKAKIKQIIKEEIIREYEGLSTEEQQKRLDEALSKKDYIEIKEIIRAEIAAVFFDLFRKRGVWI